MNHEDSDGHAVDADGRLIYDARCWFCRKITAQSPPTAKTSAGGGS